MTLLDNGPWNPFMQDETNPEMNLVSRIAYSLVMDQHNWDITTTNKDIAGYTHFIILHKIKDITLSGSFDQNGPYVILLNNNKLSNKAFIKLFGPIMSIMPKEKVLNPFNEFSDILDRK